MNEVFWTGDKYPTYGQFRPQSYSVTIPLTGFGIVKEIEDKMALAQHRMIFELDGCVNGWSKRKVAQKFRRFRERYYAKEKKCN